MRNKNIEEGAKFLSRNGMIGVVKMHKGELKMIVTKNGNLVQRLPLSSLDLSNFIRIDQHDENNTYNKGDHHV